MIMSVHALSCAFLSNKKGPENRALLPHRLISPNLGQLQDGSDTITTDAPDMATPEKHMTGA